VTLPSKNIQLSNNKLDNCTFFEGIQGFPEVLLTFLVSLLTKTSFLSAVLVRIQENCPFSDVSLQKYYFCQEKEGYKKRFS